MSHTNEINKDSCDFITLLICKQINVSIMFKKINLHI